MRWQLGKAIGLYSHIFNCSSHLRILFMFGIKLKETQIITQKIIIPIKKINWCSFIKEESQDFII